MTPGILGFRRIASAGSAASTRLTVPCSVRRSPPMCKTCSDALRRHTNARSLCIHHTRSTLSATTERSPRLSAVPRSLTSPRRRIAASPSLSTCSPRSRSLEDDVVLANNFTQQLQAALADLPEAGCSCRRARRGAPELLRVQRAAPLAAGGLRWPRRAQGVQGARARRRRRAPHAAPPVWDTRVRDLRVRRAEAARGVAQGELSRRRDRVGAAQAQPLRGPPTPREADPRRHDDRRPQRPLMAAGDRHRQM